MSAKVPYCISYSQNGMVLLLCLIFLTAMTLLGLSASADTVLQNQLTANLQEAERARQSALAALSWAENWLLGLDGPAPEICTDPCDGFYLHASGDLPQRPEFENLSWWMDHGHEAGINPLTGKRMTTITGGSISSPVWIIEAVHTIPPAKNATGHLLVWYRILVRGSGRTKAAISVIESTVVRSWPSIDSTDLPGTDVPDRCPGFESSAKCRRISWRELR